MFSGLVECISEIKSIVELRGSKIFTIARPQSFVDLMLGESIAVNGVCLTVTHFNTKDFTVEVVPETLRLTNLNTLHTQAPVNLERALKASDRIGGHYVQGHVDNVGEVISLKQDKKSAALLLTIKIPEALSNYMVKKGYITLDGMSITLIDCQPTQFTVTLISHTQQTTIAQYYKVKQLINIEIDILGKYVEKFLRGYQHANVN